MRRSRLSPRRCRATALAAWTPDFLPRCRIAIQVRGSVEPGSRASLATQKAVVDRHAEEQEKEARGLEEILRNQAHPSNLVAVKRTDTPVL